VKTLNIIGCGAVGRVVGRLFQQAGLADVQDVLNRSLASAKEAVAFIGAGRPVADYAELRPADLLLIAASDQALAGCAQSLAGSGVLRPGVLRPGDVAWQLSGALPSAVLAPLREAGVAIASVHPVRSFADPAASCAEFAGTWCGIEGDAAAVALLSEAFAALGGRIFPVDPEFKTVYHAGAVLVCNYLASLVEVGLRAYQRGGLPRETALQVMEPLMRGTLDNIFRVGPAEALTGPIARGDAALVSAQLVALDGWDGEVALIYRALGRVALELSLRREGGGEGGDALAKLLA